MIELPDVENIAPDVGTKTDYKNRYFDSFAVP